MPASLIQLAASRSRLLRVAIALLANTMALTNAQRSSPTRSRCACGGARRRFAIQNELQYKKNTGFYNEWSRDPKVLLGRKYLDGEHHVAGEADILQLTPRIVQRVHAERLLAVACVQVLICRQQRLPIVLTLHR